MLKVKEIMKEHVVTVEPGITLDMVAKILTNNRIGCVIVMDKDRPIGMISDTDIVTAIATGKDPKKIKFKDVRKIRKKEFLVVSPDENLMKVAKKFVKSGRKRFPVIDKNGDLKGIISTKEILIVSPELIEILSEKMKSRADSVARPEQKISGLCELCGGYSDSLLNVEGRWLCTGCRD